MHVQAFDFVARHAATITPAAVLEIGSLDVNGGVRSLFENASHYHGIDVTDGPGVDEVADGADWQPTRQFDVVVSTEVLEHAPRWRDVVRNAWAAVVGGGTCIITCATEPREPHSAVDGWEVREGEWYANVAARDMVALVRELGARSWVVEVARDRGDLYVRADKP